ncbi:MAG: RDD family protein [bacterium]|nr:RDD family protein [bacterium]
MANPSDDLADGFEPEEQRKSTDDGAGQELWRLLQEDGQLAGGSASPTSAKPLPDQPEDHLAAEEMDQWKRYQGQSDTQADDTRASMLRRIIDTPDEVAAEGYEVRSARLNQPGDIDSAVAGYNQTQAISCRNHPESQSVGQCPECQAFYCQLCMVIRRGKMLCRDCVDTKFVLSEDEILRAQEEGRDAEVGVAAEIPPEFQMGGFGIEGAPASPLKKTIAWLLDFGLTKSLLLLVVWIGYMLTLDIIPLAARQVFDPKADGALIGKVLLSLTESPMAWIPLVFAIDFLYFFSTQSFFNRSIGMSWAGTRIVTEWGEYVSYGAAAMRTLIFLVCLQLPAILLGFLNRSYRGPHDLMAGTLEINYSGVKRVDAYETVQLQL